VKAKLKFTPFNFIFFQEIPFCLAEESSKATPIQLFLVPNTGTCNKIEINSLINVSIS
jgi:hypothetical protein